MAGATALHLPSFTTKGELDADEILGSSGLSKARVHVERAIEAIKRFEVISNRVSATRLPWMSDIVFVCAFLTRFMTPIIAKPGKPTQAPREV